MMMLLCPKMEAGYLRNGHFMEKMLENDDKPSNIIKLVAMGAAGRLGVSLSVFCLFILRFADFLMME